MSILNQTHDEIHKRLYGITSLNDAKRKAVMDEILHLNAADDWFPDAFHRKIRALQQNDIVTEFERKAVEKEFFPDHSW